MDTIKQLCHKLNEENLDGVKNLLTKESLSVRNTFALGLNIHHQVIKNWQKNYTSHPTKKFIRKKNSIMEY